MTFAQATYKHKRAHCGPDGNKNLYYHPDENAKVAEFNIDHHAGQNRLCVRSPGRGKEPIGSPGPKALVAIGN